MRAISIPEAGPHQPAIVGSEQGPFRRSPARPGGDIDGDPGLEVDDALAMTPPACAAGRGTSFPTAEEHGSEWSPTQVTGRPCGQVTTSPPYSLKQTVQTAGVEEVKLEAGALHALHESLVQLRKGQQRIELCLEKQDRRLDLLFSHRLRPLRPLCRLADRVEALVGDANSSSCMEGEAGAAGRVDEIAGAGRVGGVEAECPAAPSGEPEGEPSALCSVSPSSNARRGQSRGRSHPSPGHSTKRCSASSQHVVGVVKSFVQQQEGVISDPGSWRAALPSSVGQAVSWLLEPVNSTRVKHTKESHAQRAKPSCLEACVRSRIFELVCALMILSNLVLIAWECEHSASNRSIQVKDMTVYVATGYAWTVWFILELGLRICAAGGIRFFFDETKWWNRFDFVVVVLSILDDFTTGLQWVWGLRFVRVVRIFRIARFLHDLRMMITSIANSMWSLFWALTLLGLILLQFALMYTSAVDMFLRNNPSSPNSVMLEDSFGSLLRSVLTLYQTITGGRSWYEFVVAIQQLDQFYDTRFYEFLFYSFTAFATLCVLNVITGIFVQGSLAKVSAEKDAMIVEEMNRKAAFVRGIEELFMDIDADDSGCITVEEFEYCVQDEHMKTYLAAHNIDVVEVVKLFAMMDLDGSGAVEIDEFVDGCVKLQVTGKSVEIAALQKALHLLEISVEDKLDGILQRLSVRADCAQPLWSLIGEGIACDEAAPSRPASWP